MSARPNFRLRRLAARSLVLYVLDLGAAIGGWIVGFGLTVHNWPALLAICIGLRWVFSVVGSAFLYQDVIEDARDRDYFAAQAMQQVIASRSYETIAAGLDVAEEREKFRREVAAAAYEYADAMLRARSASA
jgi:hypothetical protein